MRPVGAAQPYGPGIAWTVNVLSRLLRRAWTRLVFVEQFVRQPEHRRGLRHVPMWVWPRLLAAGHWPSRYWLYRLDRSPWRPYLGDLHGFKLAQIDGDEGIILADKLLFSLVMKGLVRVPRILAVKQHHQLVIHP